MSTWPCVVLESPLGHEAGGVLQESAAGRMGGPKTSVDSSLKGAWLNPVATAECRCHQNGHLAHSCRLQGKHPT